jgi:hypothetical protein
MARLMFILVIWVMQATLIVLLVNAHWVEEQLRVERMLTQEEWGREREEGIHENVEDRYRRVFLDSGCVRESYARLIPDPTTPQQGMETLAPWFFILLKARIDAFWWLVFQSVYRLEILKRWLPYIATILVAASVEGLVRRHIKRVRLGLVSGDRYSLGRAALWFLVAVLLVYLSAPIAVAPIYVPIWGVLLGACLLLVVSNIQTEI